MCSVFLVVFSFCNDHQSWCEQMRKPLVIIKMVEMLSFRLGMLNITLLCNILKKKIVFSGVSLGLFYAHDTSVDSSIFWMTVMVISSMFSRFLLYYIIFM